MSFVTSSLKSYLKAYFKSNLLLIIVSLLISYACFVMGNPDQNNTLTQQKPIQNMRVHSS
jgi:hypothetical protein